jgi:general secretion pathway protein G
MRRFVFGKQSEPRGILARRCALNSSGSPASRGFTLIELVITVAVLAILTLGVIPMVQVSIKRQKEEQLRAALREMREAIDQFHREALVGAQMQAQAQGVTAQQEQAPRLPQAQAQQMLFADPRVRVFISDQTIFSPENPDRYPPTLETLVEGVDVLPIMAGGLGRRGQRNVTALEAATTESVIPKTKIYLRRIPIDPMTGLDDWCFTSSYDPADTNCGSGGGENVFDVHSKSKGIALNGEKYSDW